ncbi:XdhC family protein [Nocardioides iriomotensis]|uniref:YHS domain-containing protein n=1 Tax=Nocardioides iriomotensis TaxID=715784 RepID=A0A4Q5J6M9_9ACTN|nr:XdhC family protein [Nocardioides iriomotensis]RYU14224.1 YHS domain-containing protein [Nocardioides iriomotensis]
MTLSLSDRIDELSRSRVPFVRATVVRAQEPSSAHPGDRAIVLADGSIEGFVGGHCAAGSVRTAALAALDSGDGVLLRVLPDTGEAFPETPGASIVVNPCLSGGAMEIYLEPVLPSPVLHLVGASPTAEALATLAPALGFVVQRADDVPGPAGSVAVVVSTHGGDEVSAIRRALDAGVGLVGVVCSRTRGAAILDELAPTPEERARVHPHVGLDIGARNAPEIALSILAAIVRAIRVDGLAAAPAPAGATTALPRTAVDPVCGMTVTVMADTPHLHHDGTDYWFCNPGCRDAFAASLAS